MMTFNSIEDAIEVMYDNPPDSEMHIEAQNAIHDFLKEKGGKYNEDLFCIPSIFNTHSLKGKASVINNYPQISRIKIPVGENVMATKEFPLFSDNQSLLSCDFIMRKRYAAEYNPAYRQLCVGVLFVVGNSVLLLSTNTESDTRIKDKRTLVQGHVTYDRDNYLETPIQTLIKNAERELREEVELDENFYNISDSISHAYFINDYSNHTAMEHVGVVFVVNVTPKVIGEAGPMYSMGMIKDPERTFNVASKEPEKHVAKLYSENMITYDRQFIDSLDSWAKLVVTDYFNIR